MKPKHLLHILLASLATPALLAQSGGPLTPPVGLPDRTMKSLDQMEPRTPLVEGAPGVTVAAAGNISITASGSYYLTENLEVLSGDALNINVDNIGLDLNGFTISGNVAAGSNFGVNVTSAHRARIANGTIRGFKTGVAIYDSNGCSVSDVACEETSESGIYIRESNAALFSRCSITGSSGSGIAINGGSGNTISRCRVSGSLVHTGIQISSFPGECVGNVVEHTSITTGTLYGLQLDAQSHHSAGNRISRCTITAPSGHGISLTATDALLEGTLIGKNTITATGKSGIHFDASAGGAAIYGNTITENTVSGAGSFGVHLGGSLGTCAGNTIIDNHITRCTTNGIWLQTADGNRVEGNHVSYTQPAGGGQSWGIESSGTSSENLIVRNSCVGQTINFAVSLNDTTGPVVTASGGLATTGAAAHPWANFSR